ncbi:MAG: hypothetical protein Q7S47_00925, partial [bacterium]|nr:hypothetical protein [bacterium]
MFISDEKLKQILIDAEVIDDDTWTDALKNAQRLGVPIEDILKERDIIAGHVFFQLVSDALKIPYVNLKTHDISDDVLALFDAETIGECKAIPFELDVKTHRLKVAFLDPTDAKCIALLERKTKYSIDVYFCGVSSFQFAAKYYQKGVAAEMKRLIEQMVADAKVKSFSLLPNDFGREKK